MKIRIINPCSMATLALLVASGILLAAEVQPTTPNDALVGNRGELARITFTGQETFSEAALRRSLKFNLDFLLAEQPQAPLNDCLRLLERLVRAGYQHAGFADATVAAAISPDTGRIVVRVKEGPRLYCGSVRVTGLKSLSPTNLAALIVQGSGPGATTNRPASSLETLSSPPVPTSEQVLHILSSPPGVLTEITNRAQVPDIPLGLWKTGSPATLDDGARRSLAEAVTNAFAALGHFSPRVQLSFPRRPAEPLTASEPQALQSTNLVADDEAGFLRARAEGRVADLLVESLDEGPSCVLGEIEVDGVKKNTRDELLRWLELAPGQKLTRDFLLVKSQQLDESVRFVQHRLEPGPPDAAGRVKLRVTVQESADAPPLSEELSRETQTLLRFREWLLGWPSRSEDMVLRVERQGAGGQSGAATACIVSPSGGLFFRADQPDGAAGRPTPQWAFLARRNMLGLFDGIRQQCLVSTNFAGQLALLANVQLNEEGHFNFSLGAGFKTETSGPPFDVKLQVTAATAAKFAQEPGMTWRSDGAVLTGSSTNGVLRVEEATGRLIEWRLEVDADILPFEVNGRLTLTQRFETNALARAEQALLADTAGFKNRYDRGRALNSSLSFLIEEVLRIPAVRAFAGFPLSPERAAAAGPALEKLLSARAFAPFEALFSPTNAGPEDQSILIPPDAAGSGPASAYNPIESVAAIVLGNGDELLPRDSWPAGLLRAQVLTLASKAELAGRAWQSLYASPELGPIACWLIGRNLNPQPARFFATKGMTLLTREDFRRDCATLLECSGMVNECLRNLVAALRDLNDAEVDSLAGLLPPADADALRQAVSALRANPATPGLAVLGPVLDEWWTQALRERVAAALRGLAVPSRRNASAGSTPDTSNR